MGRYASGSKAYGISDRSGFRYRLADMKKEWNGLLVGPDEFEEKHPQLTPPRNVFDPENLRDPRPDRVEPAARVILPLNPFTSGSSGSSVITVREPGHGRTTGDLVQFRTVESFDGFTDTAIENTDSFSVTVVDTDSYTFDISQRGSSETATVGSIKGGGKVASAEKKTSGPNTASIVSSFIQTASASIITASYTTYTVTVQSTYSGNKYFIGGSEAPTLSLTEGETYRFDQSDSSNSGHPLRLSTTANGTHGGGSEYTTGVTTSGTPGSSGAYTQIVVATGAPTLYYYCTNHSGMGGQINT